MLGTTGALAEIARRRIGGFITADERQLAISAINELAERAGGLLCSHGVPLSIKCDTCSEMEDDRCGDPNSPLRYVQGSHI